MVEISDKLYLIDAEMQGIPVLEELIEQLEKELDNLHKCLQSDHTTWLIMVAKLKRERLKAIAAMRKAKVLIAELEVFLAKHEHELNKIIDYNNLYQRSHDNKYHRNTPLKRHQRYEPYRRYSPFSSSASSNSDVSSDFYASNRTYKSTPNNLLNNRAIDLTVKPNLSSNKMNDTSDINETTSAMSQSPLSTPTPNTLNKSDSSGNKSNSNKSLSDSIIAEFNKPYWNINSHNNSNSIAYSSTPNHSMLLPNVPRKKTQNVKIKPVSNIEAYKQAYARDPLSYKSHILYAPGTVRPPLHPRDPRAYYSKSFCLEQKGIPESPMRLPVPTMIQNKRVHTPQTQNQVEQSKQVPYTPLPTKQAHKGKVSIQPSVKQDTRQIPATTQSPDQTNLPISTPIKQLDFKQLSETTPLKQSEDHHDVAIPTSLSMLQCHDYNKYKQKLTASARESEKQHNIVQTATKTINHKSMPVSTPQKWFENKHICVPTPPTYKRSATQNVYKDTSFMKENCAPPSPKRVSFYHSS